MKFNKRLLRTTLVLLLTLSLSGEFGCSNVYYDMSNHGTDAALLYQAQLDINAQHFSDAIDDIKNMTTEGQAKQDVQVVLASAYAGRCGLNSITLALNLSNSSGNLLSILFSAFPSATASSVADCQKARSILTTIGPTNMTVDQNVLLVLVAFATIGSLVNKDFNVGGSINLTADWCNAPNPLFPGYTPPSPMNDTDVVDLFVSLAWAILALANAGNTIAQGPTNAITSLCGSLPAPASCNQTDPTSYTANQIKLMRAVIGSNQGIGLGMCNGSIPTCACP